MSAVYVVTPRQMKNAEYECERTAISCAGLMENVGETAARALDAATGLEGRTALILSGSGNNGGDGFAIARGIAKRGGKATVALVCGDPKTQIAADCFERCRPYFYRLLYLPADIERIYTACARADIIIDCVYGTGFHGGLSDEIGELFDICAKTNGLKCAIDIASGCGASDGAADERAFRADITLVPAALKTGHICPPCSEKCGRLEIMDIGIPDSCYSEYQATVNGNELYRLFPARRRISHKGTYGTLLNVAGSSRYIGAAWLSANAALRTGAGLVRLFSVKDVINAAAASLHECVFDRSQNDDCINSDDIDRILKSAASADAVTAGCGMGNSEETYAVIKALIDKTDCPLVIDADGINSAAPHINEIKDDKNRLIFTPHIKEFSRISGLSVQQIQGGRLAAAVSFAKRHGVHVILKDAYSVYAAPDGFTAVNLSGNAALAKGGSGDTLTGTLGGLLAQGVKIKDACRLAMYIMGKAAELACNDKAMCGVLPSQLPELYPYLLKKAGID